MAERLGLSPSSYEGPTGIVGVVHDVCRDAGIPSASLWAAVPHYISVSPNPKAALALLDRPRRDARDALRHDGARPGLRALRAAGVLGGRVGR